MKHKHYDLIVAWAGGAEIEWWNTKGNIWERPCSYNGPAWSTTDIYRIKPESKADVVLYGQLLINGLLGSLTVDQTYYDNLKCTFDGETGKLKTAEVIVPSRN